MGGGEVVGSHCPNLGTTAGWGTELHGEFASGSCGEAWPSLRGSEAP